MKDFIWICYSLWKFRYYLVRLLNKVDYFNDDVKLWTFMVWQMASFFYTSNIQTFDINIAWALFARLYTRWHFQKLMMLHKQLHYFFFYHSLEKKLELVSETKEILQDLG